MKNVIIEIFLVVLFYELGKISIEWIKLGNESVPILIDGVILGIGIILILVINFGRKK